MPFSCNHYSYCTEILPDDALAHSEHHWHMNIKSEIADSHYLEM